MEDGRQPPCPPALPDRKVIDVSNRADASIVLPKRCNVAGRGALPGVAAEDQPQDLAGVPRAPPRRPAALLRLRVPGDGRGIVVASPGQSTTRDGGYRHAVATACGLTIVAHDRTAARCRTVDVNSADRNGTSKARTSISGQPDVRPASQCRTASANVAAMASRSVIFARTSARCAAAITRTSPQAPSFRADRCSRARTSSSVKPSSRARRRKRRNRTSAVP